jgi:Sigma-54 interaction domain
VAIEGTPSDLVDTLRPPLAGAVPPPIRRLMPVPARLPIPASDWQTLVVTRANAVVVGQEDAALRVWTAVWPALQKPIHWVEADHLVLPRHPAGTLILQGADLLTASAQQQLLAWLEGDARSTRVLTTTQSPLFPLVESGAFLAALYYRLNVLLLLL